MKYENLNLFKSTIIQVGPRHYFYYLYFYEAVKCNNTSGFSALFLIQQSLDYSFLSGLYGY